MFPTSAANRLRQRRRMREYEASLAIGFLQDELRRTDRLTSSLRILEFGCGTGFQVPALARLGTMIPSDLRTDPALPHHPPPPRYLLCDITTAPFGAGSFDVIFASHVVDQIADIRALFRELSRIRRPHGVIALILPTPTWLLLSLPTQLLDKAANLARRALPRRPFAGALTDEEWLPRTASGIRAHGALSRWLPHGHGRYPGFLEALWHLRWRAWQRLFRRHGFRVIRQEPLLAYATSRWPIIPINRWMVRLGVISSRLYILELSSSPTVGCGTACQSGEPRTRDAAGATFDGHTHSHSDLA